MTLQDSGNAAAISWGVAGNERLLTAGPGWRHWVTRDWLVVHAGKTRQIDAFIGAYLLVRSGALSVEPEKATRLAARVESPAKIPVGGGRLTLEADRTAEVALGTVRTPLHVIRDDQGGWLSALFEMLGDNVRETRRRVDYRQV